MSNYFFDYASTTPIDEKILKKMYLFDQKYFANASSIHQIGQESFNFLQEARTTIARSLNCQLEEIIFTASATESNNLALKGIALAYKAKGKHILVSQIEHDCILNSALYLKTLGYEIEFLKVNQFGLIDLNNLKAKIRPDTILVSVMTANNEIGTINPIKQIGQICKSKNVLFHTDACQAYTKIAIDVVKNNLDLLTLSSHKIYGPKGVSVLYKKNNVKLIPILHGGEQENNYRSSTYNLTAIMGLSWAVTKAFKLQKSETLKLTHLRDYFITNIVKKIKNIKLNGHPTKRLYNNAHFSFAGVEGESLLLRLSHYGIYVSTGSACSSKKLTGSYVLKALNLNPYFAHGSIRFSFGRLTTQSDIDYLIKILTQEINFLRQISPFTKFK